MIKLTQNEQKLLEYVIAESNFNGDTIDYSKHWDEQKLENEDYFLSMTNVKEYAQYLGLEINQVKGILSSLVKKELICMMEDEDDDGKPFTWLTVNEKNFYNIKFTLTPLVQIPMNKKSEEYIVRCGVAE